MPPVWVWAKPRRTRCPLLQFRRLRDRLFRRLRRRLPSPLRLHPFLHTESIDSTNRGEWPLRKATGTRNWANCLPISWTADSRFTRAARRSQAPVDICITGAALGLPGVDGVFDDSNVERILRGDVFIDQIPMPILRQQMVEKNITRLVKTEGGEGRFESIESMADVIKLAARAKEFDLIRDFGFPEDRMPALDRVTKLAIGAGIDALRDAGIPLGHAL